MYTFWALQICEIALTDFSFTFSVILEKLLTQENRVLEYWTTKKKRLDQNQQFCLFERSARQSLAWIKEEGDIYLSTHTNVGNNKEETLALLEEHNSFKVSSVGISVTR